jgi:hypothetical protein
MRDGAARGALLTKGALLTEGWVGAAASWVDGTCTGAATWRVCGALGAAPHKIVRSRRTRGTQRVFAPTPARKKMHPRLSTYCSPWKEAGGSSAGPLVFRKLGADCA